MTLFLRRHSLYLAWVIALGGLCLSLFYGEVLQNEPCPLCWYQRIALFPLAILLGIASYRNESEIIPYVLPLAILGAAAALLQILEINIPFLQKSGICQFNDHCADPVFTFFGIFNFPTLSAIGFFLISSLLFIGRKKSI